MENWAFSEQKNDILTAQNKASFTFSWLEFTISFSNWKTQVLPIHLSGSQFSLDITLLALTLSMLQNLCRYHLATAHSIEVKGEML